MKLLLACDRTKGHLYPALAIARHISSNNMPYEPVFYGLKDQDKLALKEEGFSVCGFDLGFRNIIIEAFLRFFEALAIMLIIRPNRVLGFGGRNSFFVVIFARLFFIPVSIYEPNMTLGLANKFLVPFVKYVFLGLKKPKADKEISLGIPLRGEIVAVNKDKEEARKFIELETGLLTILVFGGSLGAGFINDIFIKTCGLLKQEHRKFAVIHITGNNDYDTVFSFYKQAQIPSKVFSFYRDFGILYSACDIIISRSGASTVSEICFFGKPAILIPYPYAYGHQKYNAEFLVSSGGALCKEQSFLMPRDLFSALREAFIDFKKFSVLGQNAAKQKPWKYQEEFAGSILGYL